MSDITMCTNDACPLRSRCYRHTAKPDPYWQSFQYFMLNLGGGCDYFYPMRQNDEL